MPPSNPPSVISEPFFESPKLIEWSCEWSWHTPGAMDNIATSADVHTATIVLPIDPGGRLSTAQAALPVATMEDLLRISLARDAHAAEVLEHAADAIGICREAPSYYFNDLGRFLERCAPFLNNAWSNVQRVNEKGMLPRWKMRSLDFDVEADGVSFARHVADAMFEANKPFSTPPAQRAAVLAQASLESMKAIAERAFGPGCVLAAETLSPTMSMEPFLRAVFERHELALASRAEEPVASRERATRPARL